MVENLHLRLENAILLAEQSFNNFADLNYQFVIQNVALNDLDKQLAIQVLQN